MSARTWQGRAEMKRSAREAHVVMETPPLSSRLMTQRPEFELDTRRAVHKDTQRGTTLSRDRTHGVRAKHRQLNAERTLTGWQTTSHFSPSSVSVCALALFGAGTLNSHSLVLSTAAVHTSRQTDRERERERACVYGVPVCVCVCVCVSVELRERVCAR